MKTRNILLTAALSLLTFSGTSLATPTLDELCRFLRVESFRAAIALPSRSFTAEIYQISDGAVGEKVLPSPTPSRDLNETRLTILIAPEGGHYKVFHDPGTGFGISQVTAIPAFKATVPQQLPERLGEGDYVLFGEPREGAKNFEEEGIRFYSKGFLLRIKKAQAQL